MAVISAQRSWTDFGREDDLSLRFLSPRIALFSCPRVHHVGLALGLLANVSLVYPAISVAEEVAG